MKADGNNKYSAFVKSNALVIALWCVQVAIGTAVIAIMTNPHQFAASVILRGLLLCLSVVIIYCSVIRLLWPRRPATVATKVTLALLGSMILANFFVLIINAILELLLGINYAHPSTTLSPTINNYLFLSVLYLILAVLIGGWYQSRSFVWRCQAKDLWKMLVMTGLLFGMLLLEYFLPRSMALLPLTMSTLLQVALLIYGSCGLNRIPLFEYRSLDGENTPYYQGRFVQMSDKEAAEYCGWFIQQIPVCGGQLMRYMSATGEMPQADVTSILTDLWYWFQSHIIKLPRGSEELAQQTKNLPQFKDLIKSGRYSNETLMLGTDIGIYFGELMRAAYSSLRWDVVREGSGVDPADLGKPALVGFPDGRVFEPFRMMWLQYGKAWKRPGRKVLLELYDEWTHDLKMDTMTVQDSSQR